MSSQAVISARGGELVVPPPAIPKSSTVISRNDLQKVIDCCVENPEQSVEKVAEIEQLNNEPLPRRGNADSQKVWMKWYVCNRGFSPEDQLPYGFKTEMKDAASKYGISKSVIGDRWKELKFRGYRTIK